MIRVFGATDTNFESNGDVILRPLRAKMRKIENGDWYVDIEAGLRYADWIRQGNIVIAEGPKGEQPFRIRNVQQSRTKITCQAWHVSFDGDNFAIPDPGFDPNGEDCQDALDKINAAAMPASIFTLTTDSDFAAYPTCKDCSLTEAVKAITEEYQINHVERDGWTITLYYNRTAPDTGVTVRYGKNLKEITCDEKWDEVVTRIYPTGKDGVRLDALDPTKPIYLDSATQYDIPYCKHVNFSQEINEAAFDTRALYLAALVADLEAQAQVYLADHCVPEIAYSMSANLEARADTGDLVRVEHGPLGIEMMASVTAFEWDCILGKYTAVEFGNYTRTMRGYNSRVSEAIAKGADSRIGASLNKGGAIAGAIRTSNFFSDSEQGVVFGAQVSGFVANDNKSISFTVQLPKSPEGMSVTLEDLKCNILDANGVYILGSYVPGGYDVQGDSSLTVALYNGSGYSMNVEIGKSAGFAGLGGLPAAVSVVSMAMRFSE